MTQATDKQRDYLTSLFIDKKRLNEIAGYREHLATIESRGGKDSADYHDFAKKLIKAEFVRDFWASFELPENLSSKSASVIIDKLKSFSGFGEEFVRAVYAGKTSGMFPKAEEFVRSHTPEEFWTMAGFDIPAIKEA